jgi:hypothetical protein
VASEKIIRNLRILWRSDRTIAEVRLRHMLVGLGLKAFAALIVAFGLLSLELAGYFALVQIWSAIAAAVALGLINFAIAAIILTIAVKSRPGRELDLATEIHNSAIDALQIEAQSLQSQLSGFVQHPLAGLLPSLIPPLVAIIVRSLKKPGETARARRE